MFCQRTVRRNCKVGMRNTLRCLYRASIRERRFKAVLPNLFYIPTKYKSLLIKAKSKNYILGKTYFKKAFQSKTDFFVCLFGLFLYFHVSFTTCLNDVCATVYQQVWCFVSRCNCITYVL